MHLFAIFFPDPRLDVRLPSQILQTVQMRGKLEKFTERPLAKLHPPNLVNTFFYVVF